MLEAVVMVVAELVMSEELEVDFSEVVVLVAEVEDSVEDSVEVEAAVELALEDETETVEPSTVKRPM